MVVRLHPEALEEYMEAVAFYEERAPDLGREFFEEVERVLRAVGDSPAMGSPLTATLRRVLCRRFPFAVIYREDSDLVRVQAVMHLRRRPRYWKDRA